MRTARLASWDSVERLTPQQPVSVRYRHQQRETRDWGAYAFCGMLLSVPVMMWALGWLLGAMA